MSTDRQSTRLVLEWLREPARVDTERVLARALDQVDRTRQRRSWWPARRIGSMGNTIRIALTAAAVVIAAFVGLRLLAPPIGPPGGIPSPSPTATPGPTPIVVPAQGELTPGDYVLTTLPPLRITFTLPAAGWQKNVVPNAIWTGNSEGWVGFGIVDNLYADPCATVLTPRDPAVGPTVDDLVTALADLPGLDPGTVTDATIAGRPAKVVEIVATVDQVDCGNDGYALSGEAPLHEGRTRIFVLDVDGTRLVIQAVERPALAQVQRNELQQILDSVRIE